MGKVIAKKIRGLNLWAKVALTLVFTLTMSVFMYEGWFRPSQTHAAITTIANEMNVYHNSALPGSSAASFAVTGTPGTRMLVVTLSYQASSSAALTATSVTYGGVAMTLAGGDAATSASMHTLIYYLKDNAVMDGTAKTLAVNITGGGTSVMNNIWYAVYDGVDQAVTPTVQNYNSGSTTVTSAALTTALAVDAGDQAVLVATGARATATVTYTKPTNWTVDDNQPNGTTGVGLVATRSIPASTTTDTASFTSIVGSPRWSMTAMSMAPSVATDTTPPTAGTVTTSAGSGTYVPAAFTLTTTFTDAESTITGCEYTTNGSTWAAATWNAGTCSQALSGLSGSLTLNMRATSTGGTGTATAITRTVDSTAPVNGTLNAVAGNGQNSLDWSGFSDTGSGLDSTDSYKLVFLTGATPPAASCTNGTEITAVTTGTTYNHGSLTNGTQYYYRLCAIDSIGNISTGVTATATPAAVVCTRNTPTLTVSPSTTVRTGASTTYTVNVTNNDTTGCTDTVTFTPSLTNNNSTSFTFGSLTPATIALQAGQSGTSTFNVTAKATAVDGDANTSTVGVTAPSHTAPANVTAVTTVNNVNPLMHSAANLDPTNTKGYGNWGAGKDCAWCHGPNSTNIKQVNTVIATPTGNRSVVFSRLTSTVSTGIDLFGNDERTTKTKSSNVCEVCHHKTDFHQYSSVTKPSGKSVLNITHNNRSDCVSCHPHNKGFKGNGHNVPFYATAAGHPDLGGTVCSGCHANSSGGSYPTAGTPPNCQGCHTKGDPLTAGIGCGSCHGAAGGNGTPDGSVAPNIAGSHAKHTAGGELCTSCHDAGGDAGNPADHGPGFRGTNAAVVNLASTLQWTGAPINKCNNATCHGNVYGTGAPAQTPAWGTSAGCSACHSIVIGSTGPATGGHGTHSAYVCTSCHAPGTTATTAPSNADGHTDGNIDIVNVGYQANVTKHPANDGYGNRTCSTTCHGSPYGSGAGSTPVWGSTGSGCGACHNAAGAFITYSTPSNQKGPNTGSHSAHMNYGRYVCDECHTGAVSDTVTQSYNNAAHGDTDIDVTNQGYPANVAKHTANSGYSTCTAACHITTTWGLNTLKCVDCHAATITRTKGRPGTQLAQVTGTGGEFGLAWGHKKSGRAAVADADCIVCHLEGNFATQKTSRYHADGNIDLRDPDVQGESPITNLAGTAPFIFQRFSTSYAAGSRTTTVNETIANVVTQKFCLKCHDNNGAANTTARSNNGGTGTPAMPFGGIALGATYTAANNAIGTQGLIDVNAQFALTNSSRHPVLGPRTRDFPYSTRLAAPYNNIGTTRNANGTTGHTTAASVVINCFDCHNTSGTPRTLRTIVAHGNAATLRGTVYAGSAASTLCTTCHTGYTVSGSHSTGSAWGATGSSHNAARGCEYCHGSQTSTTAQVRPIRAQDYHGSNALVGGGLWTGVTPNSRPYAFIRGWSGTAYHRPYRSSEFTTGSATCGAGTCPGGSSVANGSTRTYGAGGTY